MKKYMYAIYLSVTFLLIDIFLRIVLQSYNYIIYGLIFNISFILILLGIIFLLNKTFKLIIYYLFVTLYFILFVTNILYNKYFDSMFSFSKIKLAGEGNSYILDVIFSLPVITHLLLLILIILSILYSKNISNKCKSDNKKGISFIIFGILLKLVCIISLGTYYNDYRSLDSLSNIYFNQINTKKAYDISGIYEYYIIDIININRTSKIDINDYLSKKEHVDNEYTDIFRDKNLIFIMMESIDNFLINDDVMPTLNYIKNNSINFNNNYSVRYNGGDTFNTEFIINTGLMPSYKGHMSFYYSDNLYPYSLANMFVKNGYSAQSFHFNTSTFYNRKTMHNKWGYNYNSLIELGYKDYGKDTIFFLDDYLTNMIIRDNKFISFIITYSAHMPYNKNNYLCSDLLFENYSEINCLNAQARETDNMIKLLLEKLEEKNLLEETVIVFYTDHFVYGFEDKNELKNLKFADDSNLLSNTPFLIYFNGMKEEVNYLNSSIDVVPTLVNMFGLSKEYNNYIGKDIFNIKDENTVYFRNNSFLYKNNYYKNNNLVFGDLHNNKIIEKKKDMYNFFEVNEKILKTNYFNE